MDFITREERDRLNFLTVSKRQIPKDLIEERKQGGQTFNYISGTTCLDILNEATINIGYDFNIIDVAMHAAEDKAVKEWSNEKRTYVPKKDRDGNQVYEKQPPYVTVTASLYIPGFGTREQCGSAQLVGGTSEQESAKKGAATDALKKCCSQFGIGAQLYTNAVDNRDTLTAFDVEQLKKFNEEFGIVNNDFLSELVKEFLGNYRANSGYLMPCNYRQFMLWYKQEKLSEIKQG